MTYVVSGEVTKYAHSLTHLIKRNICRLYTIIKINESYVCRYTKKLVCDTNFFELLAQTGCFLFFVPL